MIPFFAVLSINYSDSYAYNAAEQQGVAITVSTDKKEYFDGDILIISGAVRSPAAKTPLTLQILDNNNNLIHIAQTNLAQDGTYAVAIKIGGPLWDNYGTYTVRVQYGFHHVGAQTTFDLIEMTAPSKQIFHVNTGSHGYFDIPYAIKGGIVNDMQIDYTSLTLKLLINATNVGYLNLDIPREFMDAKKMDGSDEKFIVLINGTEITPTQEQAGPTSRNVTINFLHDDSQIELIGTQMVPEFGSISSSMLLISVTSVIFLTLAMTRNKVSK